MVPDMVLSRTAQISNPKENNTKRLSVYIFIILEARRILTSEVHFLTLITNVNYGFNRNSRACRHCLKRNDLNYIRLIWRPHYIPSCQRSRKILCKTAVIDASLPCDFLLLYIRHILKQLLKHYN